MTTPPEKKESIKVVNLTSVKKVVKPLAVNLQQVNSASGTFDVRQICHCDGKI